MMPPQREDLLEHSHVWQSQTATRRPRFRAKWVADSPLEGNEFRRPLSLEAIATPEQPLIVLLHSTAPWSGVRAESRHRAGTNRLRRFRFVDMLCWP
jgi:hypothetical protein